MEGMTGPSLVEVTLTLAWTHEETEEWAAKKVNRISLAEPLAQAGTGPAAHSFFPPIVAGKPISRLLFLTNGLVTLE
jgi:hypothetical protein